jgi:hypothetical protein
LRLAALPLSAVTSSGAVIAAINVSLTTRVLWAKIVMGSQRRFLAEFCLFFKAMMLLCVVNFPHNSGPQRRYG